MSKNYNELIENLNNQFIEGLNKKGLQWFKDWKATSLNRNGKSLKEYNGVNALSLSFNGFMDSRYYTFLQAQEKGYKVRKGSKASDVIKFSYWDKKAKKCISWAEYSERAMKGDEDVSFFIKVYSVFNAEQLEGIELEEQAQTPKYDTSLLDLIAKNMGVEIEHGSPYQYPCYVPAYDKVFLPSTNLFKSESGLLATGLHELSHATARRLGRNEEGRRNGSKQQKRDYAYEELIAETSATILCNYWDIENEVQDNHIAYIQSWLKSLENDKKYFIEAYKEAEKCANYIINLVEGA